MTFLEKQKCKGLVITSCGSGGESSLFNISVQAKQEIESYENQPQNQKFTTIVRSIGDFPSYSNQDAEKDVGLF
ncbi:MAG: hypothetical protein HWD61_07775 [Parachlamydiaceae bacterium]|nr:MAG: hypothetical protein HWD61_07775 [Parachlamydiaceae bacterium]